MTTVGGDFKPAAAGNAEWSEIAGPTRDDFRSG
jgi:hypothetical protein